MRPALLYTRRIVADTVTRKWVLHQLAIPLLFTAFVWLQAGFGAWTVQSSLNAAKLDHIAIDDAGVGLGEDLTEQLAESTVGVVPLPPDPDAALHEGRFDGVLRLDDTTLRDGSFVWRAPARPDDRLSAVLSRAVRHEVIEHHLSAAGVDPALVDADGVRWEQVGGAPAREQEALALFALAAPYVLQLALIVSAVAPTRSRGLRELLASTLTPRDIILGDALARSTILVARAALWATLPALGLISTMFVAGVAGPLATPLVALAAVTLLTMLTVQLIHASTDVFGAQLMLPFLALAWAAMLPGMRWVPLVGLPSAYGTWLTDHEIGPLLTTSVTTAALAMTVLTLAARLTRPHHIVEGVSLRQVASAVIPRSLRRG